MINKEPNYNFYKEEFNMKNKAQQLAARALCNMIGHDWDHMGGWYNDKVQPDAICKRDGEEYVRPFFTGETQ